MQAASEFFTPSRPAFRRAGRRLLAALLTLGAASIPCTRAATVFTETFTGTTAPGWVFDANPGDTLPVLTANTVDSPGTGWLRLNTNLNNQSTSALLDTQIFSVNAKIEIEMEFAFFNGTGADGITFFLVDGTQDSSTFAPGAYGGSMGYAQRTGEDGMAGGYLGFALDTFGNYSNDEEGRTGGYASGLRPNNVVVRGPASSNWAYIDDSGDLGAFDFNGAAPGGTGQEMDFYGSATRPDQSGANYRQFKITLDANNQLSVEMRFGVGNDYVEVFTSDLSAFERPETFKIGFTGATGGSTGIHEVRNLTLTSTPWSSGSGAYEWDNGAGTTTWGTSAGTEANSNWYSSVSGDDNKTPTPDSDILFGNKPASGPQSVNLANNVEVRNMTFDTPYDYTLSGAGVITFGDATKPGLPSINVNNYNGANSLGRHKINNDLEIVENLAIRNYSYSTLCLNGDIDLGSRTITTSGYGLTNFNGVITGSGPIVVNGASSNPATGQGIVTISGDNSATYTGAITVNGGQLVALDNGALGNTGASTTVNSGGTLTFRGGITTSENISIRGTGVTLGRGELAGAIYNDGGDNTLNGTVTLAADASIGSRDGNLTLNGVVSGTGRVLTKIGAGVVTLTNGSNSNTGGTTISEGVLRIQNNVNALSGGFVTDAAAANLNLAGGVLEIGANSAGTATLGTFQRSVGTGAEQVRWTGDGGFSAHAFNATVTLAGGGLTWGSGSFVPTGNALLLSSDYANATVTFTNAIALGSAQREVRVADGSAALDGTLSGALTGTGGLVKTGDGTLSLTSGSNTYSGATEIRAGALRGNVSASSNTELEGGVRELNADYSGNLGAGAGEVRWTGDGGFSAESGVVTVNFGNFSTLVWNSTAGFLTTGSTLVLGSRSAAGTLVLGDAIDLDGAERTIRVVNGSAATDARLDGAVSDGSLRLTGDGRLDTNTTHTLSGNITIIGAELRLNAGTTGQIDNVTALELRQGGRLTIDNFDGNNNDRLNNALAVTLAGGRLDYLGDDGGNSTETIGSIILSSGANTLNIQRGDTDDRARLTTSTLTRTAGQGATLDLTNEAGGGSFTGGTNDNPQFRVTTVPTFDDGILAYATVNGADFAGLTSTDYLFAYTGYDTGNETAWTSTADNAAPTTSQTITAARTINSLKLAGGVDVTQAGFTLTLQSGGLLTTGGTSATVISGGVLTTGGANELIIHAYNTVGTEISSTLSGFSGGLTKSGTGTLTLSGTSANTYTGTTTVNSGTLVLAKSDDVVSVAGDLVIGDGRGIDTVRLDSNEQIADAATVTLRGGEVGNAANVARLELDGATNDTFGSRIESFTTLSITGNTILDFGGGTPCSPTFLYLDFLDVAADSLLTITNWIEFTDFLLVAKDTFTSEDLGRVIFDGYGGAASWKDYDSNYYQIIPYAPVPEPAAYGLLSLGGLAGFALLRRRRRDRA